MKRFELKPSHGENVENHKRRHALSFGGPDPESRIFFEKILSVKKVREFVFITKATARSR